MNNEIKIFLLVNTNTYDPVIIYKSQNIKIKKEIIIEDIVEKDKTFEFDVKNIYNSSANIIIKKILINNVEANISHNTSFIMQNKKLKTVHEINCNGKFQLQINNSYLELLRSEHWHILKNKNDYIFNYTFFTKDSFDLIYRPRNHKTIISNTICALGDSFTWGSGLPRSDTWPAILEKKINKTVLNLAVPGASIDLIYMNLKKLTKEFSFEKIIINLPNMERRLIRCQLDQNKFYQVPSVFQPPASNNQWLYSNFPKVKATRKKVEKKIFDDINCVYSKKVINKLITFTKSLNVPIYVTSRDKNTYIFLQTKHNEIKVLPTYPDLHLFPERDRFDGTHPARSHNEHFVDSILKFLL
jgi:hypothetical protein